MQLVLQFWRTQVGKKIVMAITGLIGVGFVVGHMVGNLQVFQGPETFNAYAALLHGPLGKALWLVRAVLLASVILHVVAAVQLTRQKQAARADGYSKWEPQISTFASRTIRIGGFLLLFFIVYHILHFTARPAFTSPGYSDTDAYGNVLKGFSNPLIVAFYVAAMAALALHLFHGAWSSFRTLGLVQPKPRPTVRPIASLVAAIIALGFAVVPVAVYFKLVPAGLPDSATVQAPAPDAATLAGN